MNRPRRKPCLHRLLVGWVERVRARAPIGDEPKPSPYPQEHPLPITLRTTASAAEGLPLALEEASKRADQIQLAYDLPWPATSSPPP
jgi:hypothetical protein